MFFDFFFVLSTNSMFFFTLDLVYLPPPSPANDNDNDDINYSNDTENHCCEQLLAGWESVPLQNSDIITTFPFHIVTLAHTY